MIDPIARVSSPYLTRDEAADYLRVSVDTIDHLRQSDRLREHTWVPACRATGGRGANAG